MSKLSNSFLNHFKPYFPYLILALLQSCSTTQTQELFNTAQSILKSPNSSALTEFEVTSGLKEALSKGAQFAVNTSSKPDGFYKNADLFIPFPAEAKAVKDTLNSIGMNSLISDFEKTLNRGAELASKQALNIFAKSISQMTLEDAFGILNGGPTSATDYLKKSTLTQITTSYSPIIQNALNQVQVTQHWSKIMSTYNSVPFVKPINTNLTAYVTAKATDGLFKEVAVQETEIRKNPLARTSEILKKVFKTAQ